MSGRPPGPAWTRSMRVRILAVVVGLLLLSSLGSVLVLRTVLFDGLDEEIETALDREAEEFRLLSTGSDPDTGEPFDGDLPAIFDVYFRREIPDEGESIMSFIDGELYEARRAQGAADTDVLQDAIDYWLSLDAMEQGSIDTPFGETRYVAVPIDGKEQRGVFVVANFPAFERGEIDDAVRTQIVVQLGTLVFAAMLGLLLAGRVLRPLRALADTAQQISDTDLERRIPVTGTDEASQIAATFNDMLARLEAAFTSQRRFLDDTSHELRTPLTIIRGHVELLELATTSEQRQDTIELVTDEIDRMTGIVNDLFVLASVEHPGFLAVERLDLRDVVRDTSRKATALASRDWQVDAEGAQAVLVMGDRHRLSQALLQLAANAVDFTTESGRISMGTRAAGGRACLWVDDNGTGVSPEDAEVIFERTSRGRGGTGRGGAGLGLAIVTAIAEAHGGSVELADKHGPGARFEITIPIVGSR